MTFSGTITGATKLPGGDNRWTLSVEVKGAQSTELLRDEGNLADPKKVIGSKRTDADLKPLVGAPVSFAADPVKPLAPVAAPEAPEVAS